MNLSFMSFFKIGLLFELGKNALSIETRQCCLKKNKISNIFKNIINI